MKKAQIKMWTTIAILIVFFVLVALGFIFYTKIEEIGMKKAAVEAESLRAMQVSQAIVNLPELQCSTGAVEKGVCFDLYKINATKTVIDANWPYYYDFFGYATITVNKIYPDPKKSWVLYDNPGGKNSSYIAHLPVSIYNETASPPKYYFGVLEVRTHYG